MDHGTGLCAVERERQCSTLRTADASGMYTYVHMSVCIYIYIYIYIIIITNFSRNLKLQIQLGTSKARQTYSPCLNFTAQNMHAARCFLQRGQCSWVGSEGSALFVKCTFASFQFPGHPDLELGLRERGGEMTVCETLSHGTNSKRVWAGALFVSPLLGNQTCLNIPFLCLFCSSKS